MTHTKESMTEIFFPDVQKFIFELCELPDSLRLSEFIEFNRASKLDIADAVYFALSPAGRGMHPMYHGRLREWVENHPLEIQAYLTDQDVPQSPQPYLYEKYKCLFNIFWGTEAHNMFDTLLYLSQPR